MLKSLDELIIKAKGNSKVIAVAVAEDESVLSAVVKAKEMGIADFILCGDEGKIIGILKQVDGKEEDYEIINCKNEYEAANKAAELVTEKKADTVMKGKIKTGSLLKILLKDDYSFKTGKTMSLVAAFEIPGYDRFLIVSDPGMVLNPDLKQKVEIINNCIPVANSLGIEIPKVGIIGAVEVVNPKMQTTLDAAIISKMAERGQIKGAIVDGPFALDNVVSLEAAEHKGIVSPVAGKADIILVPNIEAGNILYKALVFLAKADVATSIMGGSVPIILTSRADSEETKLKSIALNVVLSEVMK